MVNASEFVDILEELGIEFFSGVPDSLLSGFCLEAIQRSEDIRYEVAANEGVAVATAIGYFLASQKIPLVYLQNSGLGNAINPLTSIAAPRVFGIPIVLLIGWRGEIDSLGMPTKDEPQHQEMGQRTLEILTSLGIESVVLDEISYESQLRTIVNIAAEDKSPVAVIARRGFFESALVKQSELEDLQPITRREAVSSILSLTDESVPIVASTGFLSREFMEQMSPGSDRLFPNVGGMGHTSGIAIGVANFLVDSRVICVEGDGSFLMHAGVLPSAAATPNLAHIVLNNGCHESVGGFQTASHSASFSEMAKAAGYQSIRRAAGLNEFDASLIELRNTVGSFFLEVVTTVVRGSASPRSSKSLADIRTAFMAHLKEMSQRGR